MIRWDAEERMVWAWSADPATLRKMDRFGLTPHRAARRQDGTLHSVEYRVPPGCATLVHVWHDRQRWPEVREL